MFLNRTDFENQTLGWWEIIQTLYAELFWSETEDLWLSFFLPQIIKQLQCNFVQTASLEPSHPTRIHQGTYGNSRIPVSQKYSDFPSPVVWAQAVQIPQSSKNNLHKHRNAVLAPLTPSPMAPLSRVKSTRSGGKETPTRAEKEVQSHRLKEFACLFG